MPVIDDERIARIRVFAETLRQRDEGGEVHVPAPELRQPLAADTHVLDPVGLLERLDRRDPFGQRECGAAAVPANCHRLRVEVAGLGAPLLALALVGRHFQFATIAHAESLVAVQEGLHAILAGRQVAQLADGKTEGIIIDAACCTGRPALDVDAVERDRAAVPVDEIARLLVGGLIRGREDQQQTAVLRTFGDALRQHHVECGRCGECQRGQQHEAEHGNEGNQARPGHRGSFFSRPTIPHRLVHRWMALSTVGVVSRYRALRRTADV